MFRDSFKLSFKIILLVTAYYILDYFFERDIIVIILIAIIVVMITINILLKGNPDASLEILCDAGKYLEKVKSKYSKRDENIYNTRLAYAYIYKGENILASTHILKVDKLSLIKKPKEMMIYYLVLLKLAFEESNLEKFNNIYNEYLDQEYKKYEGIDIKVLRIPKYLIEERYTELIDKLIDLIPTLKKRYLIIELEYYLALAYFKTNQLEDAKAVSEFVGSKEYDFIYVEKCNELLKKL